MHVRLARQLPNVLQSESVLCRTLHEKDRWAGGREPLPGVAQQCAPKPVPGYVLEHRAGRGGGNLQPSESCARVGELG